MTFTFPADQQVNGLKDQEKTIAKLHSELTQQRYESTQAQQKHLKWQEQLREKIALFREEKRNWQSEAARIRSELSAAQATVQQQKDELAVVKNE